MVKVFLKNIVVCWAVAVCSVAAAESFTVFPSEIELSGNGAEARVLVQLVSDGDVGGDANAQISVADESIVKYEDGRVIAQTSGNTELSVRVGEKEMTIPVRVGSRGQSWEFSAHVQSILAKQGCNSGACHGALSGKGGFRLSLRGYDALSDHYNITRQNRGRRITPADPASSLLLAKPSGLIPHKGGLRLDPASSDYRILADWIASGYPGPEQDSASLTSVEILPGELTLEPGDKQQLIVRAKYADGRTEDVTHWAKFSSSNEVVAQVSESGEVTILAPGKGAVVAWFASRIAIASLVVRYQTPIQQTAYRDFRPRNLIDEILLTEWQRINIVPSPTCDDATFVRRAYLDSTGTIPTPEKVREFLGDPDEARREKLIDELLQSKQYVDYWAYQWSDLLLVNGNLLRPDAVASFYKWIRQQVESNTPWDEFAREVVLAKGESMEQGATNFYAIHQDPESLTENTCQAFMGLSIGCAKCHNHPLEKWTNDQYYAMANMFARVRAKGWGGDTRNGDGKRTLVVLSRGDLIQPSRGVPQPPAALDQEPIAMDDPGDRREALASWLTSSDNRLFSRSIVNRVWANYFGSGLVDPVDDLRESNPASSEKLLDALADYLIENKYDLKLLSKLILNSSTYQRSAEANASNKDDERFFARYYPRRLMAEVLHDAIVSVTNVPTKFTEIEFPGADKRGTDFYPEGTRSIELYDSAVVNYFLKTFGRHQRRITCDCERSDQPTVVQVLHLNNGDTINDKLKSERCIISTWESEKRIAEQAIEEAYLTALSRFPSAEERTRILGLINDADSGAVSRRETYEDLLWSLMTSPEFLFTH